ncbi:MAG: tRNA (guanosine(46)-N7)-methyltransferase TrmB [Bdellovibrionales bacterium]|nr:tRNA (guanosine(46)-N7)-methyltransferase TrmB [Bdellovibrionales bacterium]
MPARTPLSAERLPLTHPDYKYGLARNPYSAKLREFPSLAYSDNATETYAGAWREKFGIPGAGRELHVEIGCNTGHVTRAWAAENPEKLYIGIDWKFKIIHRGAEKTAEKGLRNLLFFRANVERLRFMFGAGEVDALYLYFPDPWPKKAQWKNRFLKESTLREAARVVRPGGLFHIKTDHDGYYEWMRDAFAKVGDVWEIERETTDLHAGNPDAGKLEIPAVTLFEKLFIKDGIKIKSAWLRRRG